MSKFFINRPIVAMVIAIIMVIIGVVAMVQLPIAQYPELAPPEILVRRPMSAPIPKRSNNQSPRRSSSKCRASTKCSI